MEITIEKGKKNDLPLLMELIRELAEYERELHQVTNTIEMMEIDGFGNKPVFEFILAKRDAQVIGAAIYYYRYSTWKGKRLYLEDLIVTESYRGQGAGKKLFDQIIAIAKDESCTGMMWQVLDWNEPAITFYKKYNTEFDAGWLNCHLQFNT